jgi:soluble lytic murein transglycosylase-like protein
MHEGRNLPTRFPALLTSAVAFVFFSGVNLWPQQRVVVPTSQVEAKFSTLQQELAATADATLISVAEGPNFESTPAPMPSESLKAFPRKEQKASGYESAVERVQALRAILGPVLQQEGVPQELSAVVLVESGGQATALSRKGALGLWQLMPATARRYGLVVTPELDERVDLEKSTRAAVRYLHDLHSQFGDWPLALAAYNAGEDRIARSLGRSARADYGYLGVSSRMPAETQRYVPAVLNAIGMMKQTSGNAGRWPHKATAIYAETTLEN